MFPLYVETAIHPEESNSRHTWPAKNIPENQRLRSHSTRSKRRIGMSKAIHEVGPYQIALRYLEIVFRTAPPRGADPDLAQDST